jgi:hypothetical protein
MPDQKPAADFTPKSMPIARAAAQMRLSCATDLTARSRLHAARERSRKRL